MARVIYWCSGLAAVLATLLSAWVSPVGLLAQTPPPTEATKAADLVTRWTIIVTERFESSRAFKSDTTDELFDQLMARGAVQAVKDKATPEQLRTADASIDRFTRAAIRSGQRLGDGSVEVTDESVVAAVKATCPVYPFC